MFLRLVEHSYADIVLCDLDSTLCDTQHRRHLAPITDLDIRSSWHGYSMDCAGDSPIPGNVALVRLIQKSFPLYILSYRDGCAMELTQEWLAKHKIWPAAIQLSSDEDTGEDGHNTFKVRMAEKFRKLYGDPVLMIDDFAPLAGHMAAINVPCVTTVPHYYDHITLDTPPVG